MKRATIVLILAAGLASASCEQQMSRDDRIARNCQSAGEGESLFKTYNHKLKTIRDWQNVGWIRQVPITKWIACRNKIESHAPIDDCLDHLSYDDKQGALAFGAAIDRCVAFAQKRQSRS